MLVIIAALMSFILIDSAIAFLAEIAEEGLQGFAGGFRLLALVSPAVCHHHSSLIP